MVDTRPLVGARPDGKSRRFDIVAGYVSLNRPAPVSFDDPAWVIIPSHSAEVPVPLAFPASHGATLPVQGTPVTVAYDDQDGGAPVLIAWQGAYTAP